MIGRHNSLAQKLEAEIIRMASLRCHAHRLASACCYTAADLYSTEDETAKALSMHLWKSFIVSRLRSACLAMHQTTKLQRVFKTKYLSSEANVRARSEILAVWAALKQLGETKNAKNIVLLRLVNTKYFIMVLSFYQHCYLTRQN